MFRPGPKKPLMQESRPERTGDSGKSKEVSLRQQAQTAMVNAVLARADGWAVGTVPGRPCDNARQRGILLVNKMTCKVVEPPTGVPGGRWVVDASAPYEISNFDSGAIIESGSVTCKGPEDRFGVEVIPEASR